ncbi:Ig-like domain repeat protein, partial [Methanobrevibacter sp.]|uniref:Ig-like domain repeat protein n=1 Tax=Methanobrevibacter sp. TaxID=66852 RepID=UPI00388EE8CC
GQPIKGAKVGFANNGVKYIVTDANGQAKYSTSSLAPGTYNVKMKFYGNDAYGASNQISARIVVNNVATKLPSSDVTVLYGANGYLVATLTNANGQPIKGAKVGFANNGVKYIVTDANGQAKYSTSSLAPGTYNVKMKFYGNDAYSASNQASAKIVVNNVATKLTSADVNVAYGSNGYLVATLKDANGKAISGAKVGFANNGVKYIVTDANGQAKYSTSGLAIGTYNVKMKFYGNDAYGESNQASAKITVNDGSTKLISADVNVVYGANSYLVATLKDANGKPISGAKVGFANNGVKYIVTDANGQAKYSTSGLAVGTYTVQMRFYGNDAYSASSQISAKIKVSPKTIPSNVNGYFVFGADMKNVNLNTLSSNGVTDLFLNYYAIEKHGKSAVENWIGSASKLGIRVHIWMQAFYDDGGWVNPVSGGSYNTAFSNYKIDEAQNYAKLKGVSGILLDYLRYPGTAYKTSGGTDAISKFTKLVTDGIHKVNSALIVSATLMPETTSSAYYYGQDYSAISKYVDVVMPMIYKGNYGKSTSWIQTTAKWYVDNSKGAKVWAVLQSYKSDDDVTKLSVSALTTDIKSALSGGSNGIIIFRYGLTNLIDFKTVGGSSTSSSPGPASISINDILTASNNLKNYYSSNGVMPKTVTAAGHAFTLPEFLYLMTQAAYQLGNSNNAAIKCIYGVKAAANPSGDSINAQLLRKDYLTLAKNVANYIKSNNQAPNYGSSAVGKVSYNVLPDAFSRILAFYKNNDKYMPNYVKIVQGSGSSSSSYSVGGMNVRNTITNLGPYYQATSNCQVNNAAIKNLVNSLTAGLTTAKEKATVIFNYVRDKVSYSYYYDTHKGAVGTLNAKSGNCVDQAHLLIAMYRTAGLAARYEHGTCYFTLSGNTYGHVWTQVLIDNVWVVGDPTSERNSFGKVVSWNTNSYTHKAYYASLPF